jgi:hypothetical protein
MLKLELLRLKPVETVSDSPDAVFVDEVTLQTLKLRGIQETKTLPELFS